MKKAFTLAEVLITLGIIGVVAAMTIPTLIQSYQEKQMVTGLQKFNSIIQQAVMSWKNDIDCTDNAYYCLVSENLPDNAITNFYPIAKFMRVVKNTSTDGTSWLPDDTLNYYGAVEATAAFGKVSKTVYGNGAFMLEDGMTFSMDVEPAGFDITVDVNGSKLPNRIGKDTYRMTIGNGAGSDIRYYPIRVGPFNNGQGLCNIASACNPNNVDPTLSGGASPTAYVLLNGKWPDFKALSQSVAGFKP